MTPPPSPVSDTQGIKNTPKMLPADEVGWVIERYVNSELQYWDGHGIDSFRTDNLRAVRFARKEDADYVLAWCCGGNGRSAEHMWCASPPHPVPPVVEDWRSEALQALMYSAQSQESIAAMMHGATLTPLGEREIIDQCQKYAAKCRAAIASCPRIPDVSPPPPSPAIETPISTVPCTNCCGPVREFVVPNDVWNAVVRRNGREHENEYLCDACYRKLVDAFVRSRLPVEPEKGTEKVLKFGCRISEKKPGTWDVDSTTGNHYLSALDGPWFDYAGPYCTNPERGCFDTEALAIAALNACTTPPPDSISDPQETDGKKSLHVEPALKGNGGNLSESPEPKPVPSGEWLPEGMIPAMRTDSPGAAQCRDEKWRAEFTRQLTIKDEGIQRLATQVSTLSADLERVRKENKMLRELVADASRFITDVAWSRRANNVYYDKSPSPGAGA